MQSVKFRVTIDSNEVYENFYNSRLSNLLKPLELKKVETVYADFRTIYSQAELEKWVCRNEFMVKGTKHRFDKLTGMLVRDLPATSHIVEISDLPTFLELVTKAAEDDVKVSIRKKVDFPEYPFTIDFTFYD